MRIDHHLQLEIVQRLAASDVPMAFSDLKILDIENSLFNYHLQRLLDRGIVEKHADGYELSVQGARWLNDHGMAIDSSERLRAFITLVIEDGAGQILLAERTGQFRTKIHDYLLPSINLQNDEDLANQTSEAVRTYIPEAMLLQRSDFGFVQIKAHYENNVEIRSLLCLSKCNVRKYEAPALDGPWQYAWYTKDDLDQIDHASADIIRQILTYTATPANQHVAPLFEGFWHS